MGIRLLAGQLGYMYLLTFYVDVDTVLKSHDENEYTRFRFGSEIYSLFVQFGIGLWVNSNFSFRWDSQVLKAWSVKLKFSLLIPKLSIKQVFSRDACTWFLFWKINHEDDIWYLRSCSK